jgi:hypothetical protein
MGDSHMDGIAIIYALVIAMENGYKLEGIYEKKEECKVIEKQQEQLAKCFKLTIDQTTIDKSYKVMNEKNRNRN